MIGAFFGLMSWVAGLVLSVIEPLATGDGTLSLLVRGFAIRRRNAARLKLFAQALHSGAMQGKTILVTGSARGLGSGIAAHLAASGARLILPHRNGASAAALQVELARTGTAVVREADPKASTLEASAINVVSPLCGLELGSFTSIERLVDALEAEGVLLDALINNAGMVPIAPGVTSEGFEKAFGVNFLGTAHLTLLLVQRGLLKPDATIVNVSSEEHRLASLATHTGVPPPPSARRWHATGAAQTVALGAVPSKASMLNAMDRYAYSKLLLTTFSHELARRFPLAVRDICPGPVASEIARDAPWPICDLVQAGMWAIFPSPADAALPVIELLRLPRASDKAPVHYHMCEAKPAGSRAEEAAIGAWLWEQTQGLIAARCPPES